MKIHGNTCPIENNLVVLHYQTQKPIIMKASELIKKLQDQVAASGDKDVIFAANRHGYKEAKVVADEAVITLALFDKVEA